jgi:hypothetical protein
MSTETAWVLIGAGPSLAVAGAVLPWVASAARAKPRRPWMGRLLGARSRALTGTSVVCGVIAGAQWAVLRQAGPKATWVAVLWLPAFLAAATVVRLLAVIRILGGRRCRARAVCPGRGSER